MVAAQLVVAKLSEDLTVRHRTLLSVAAVLIEAVTLDPSNSALLEASAGIKDKGAPWQLLQVSSGTECMRQWKEMGDAATQASNWAAAVTLYNGARKLNPDDETALSWLKDALAAELRSSGGRWRAGIAPGSATFFSQVGQDQWVFENVFRPAGIRGGTFLEAGAVDGVTNSNTLFFERSLGWTGVCLEPSPAAFRELVTLRPSCTGLHVAISSSLTVGEEVFLSGVTGNALCKQRGGLQSALGQDGLDKLQKDCSQVEHVTVAVKPLKRILAELGVQQIEFMSLDLEGAEYVALEGIDWASTTVLCLCIEDNDESGSGMVRRLLESKGYTLVRSIGQDDIYVHSQLVGRLSAAGHHQFAP